jgi:CubicO group peptidase (beta-lactamase class C family)
MKHSNWRSTIIGLALAAAAGGVLAGLPVAADESAQVDLVFAKWTTATPGCAVGVAVDGKPALTRAYGMADLEHDVKNTAETIFEAGSVSKQFTAAAVLLLARDGKLSLDDPVKTYIPELPDYPPSPAAAASGLDRQATPLLIRHMLNHTSGLRDWGSVAGIGGWPRTSRVYTQAHVLDIVSRQHALNFPTGTRWSYSNTGFNLAAIIVSRVSGMSFSDFTRTRIFEPLKMTHTSWRDDHTRVVKNRAVAYDEARGDFHTDMPFENVFGNGGLLTTVGDLLKWNENFVTPTVGDAAFVAEQQQVGTFSDGRAHNYALGLYNRTYKGVRQVDHSGSTAGYRADLARYPDQHLSVAVLCNVTSGNATQAGRAVADVYLRDRAKAPAPPTASYTLTDADIEHTAGFYRHTITGVPLTIARGADGLRVERGQPDGLNPNPGQPLVAMSASRFVTALAQTWEFDGRGGARMTDAFGRVDAYERVPAVKPTVEQLRELTGAYVSDEAETTLTAAIDGDALVIKRRPATTLRLTPLYADAFSAPRLGLVIFRRTGGRVTALSVVEDRVWDLRFARQAASPVKTSSQ